MRPPHFLQFIPPSPLKFAPCTLPTRKLVAVPSALVVFLFFQANARAALLSIKLTQTVDFVIGHSLGMIPK